MATISINKGESARIINRGTVKIETDDGSIESIVDRIRRRRLVKTNDGKFEVCSKGAQGHSGTLCLEPERVRPVVAKAEKTAPKDETETDETKTDEQRTTKSSDLTKQLVLVDTGVDDSKKFDLQNFGNTNFPRNTPVYINGPKGSGKTYLLSAVLQYVFKHDLCRRMFYIYAENVDTTISRAVPKDKMYQIPKAIALGIMIKYLSKKKEKS